MSIRVSFSRCAFFPGLPSSDLALTGLRSRANSPSLGPTLYFRNLGLKIGRHPTVAVLPDGDFGARFGMLTQAVSYGLAQRLSICCEMTLHLQAGGSCCECCSLSPWSSHYSLSLSLAMIASMTSISAAETWSGPTNSFGNALTASFMPGW